MIQSINPATGAVVATYEEHEPAEVAQYVADAHERFREWRSLGFGARAAVLERAAELLEERGTELTELMAVEMGKPVKDGWAEIAKCAWVCRHYAAVAEDYLASVSIPTEHTASYTTCQPLGVVLAVMPWNYPLWQVFRFAAPALMAGNAGLLKHASNVTGCALAIEALLTDAGLPAGLFRALLIPSSRVESIIADSRVVAATLTGSGPAGAAVAGKAGSLLKKTVLELGGSDPYVVLADADLDLAVNSCAAGRMVNSGQSCIAAKRLVVLEEIHDRFVDKLVAAMSSRKMGDPLDPETDLGPQARLDLRDELHRQVTESARLGAEILLGGEVPHGPGAFYPATVVTRVTGDMPVYREETFGPVAAVISAPDEESAIAIANDSDFGLGAAIFTRDVERGRRIAEDRIEAGSCFVNAQVASDPRLPFGGIRQSGYGRELAAEGIREFVNVKTVVIA